MDDKVNHSEEEIRERYRKALESAVQKAPIRSGERLYLTDLWAITSIPEEVIVETLASSELKLPEGVSSIVDDRRKKKRIIYGKRESNEKGGGPKQPRIRKVQEED
ncbi:hypothetical protein V511_03735 [Mesotoga sp. Brook.08.YT.4.2.5.1]|jgi:hypothetical protein|uniref:Uncharacterized protein n=1 Tax=Mesotoga prima TaxID=1184387 RepID=A0A101HNA2_9BACT|nr:MULTISPECIES: hypothetical protein [unclassified Mesotoga]KUK80027.1 MAG: Uncharacterized protein XD94_1213 [Mesotoga prima]RAM60633.1 hypothetical protein DS67_06990 [Mesotoga sp. SC_4PWA21]PNE22988.1 hypothetical protein V511_03735 [Mesotoga sp. Brook.08.YT.4.2.5.1]PNS42084.1 hypothetical protein RJ60_03485 [Mesotoga sp. B105.6.4]PVD15945.1 hypothetical protein V512_003205 [Mesotoga sp. Brook.08.105.5.1]